MIDSKKISNLLELKKIWPQLIDCFTPIDERLEPVMPLLVDMFKGVSFTVWTSTSEKMRYKLLDESSTLVTNETKHCTTRMSSYVFICQMLRKEAAFRKKTSPMMTPAYKRGNKLKKIIWQVES